MCVVRISNFGSGIMRIDNEKREDIENKVRVQP